MSKALDQLEYYYLAMKGNKKACTCHEKAEAFAKYFGYKRVDGMVLGMQHSWVVHNKHILDVAFSHIGGLQKLTVIYYDMPLWYAYKKDKLPKTIVLRKKRVKYILRKLKKHGN